MLCYKAYVSQGSMDMKSKGRYSYDKKQSESADLRPGWPYHASSGIVFITL